MGLSRETRWGSIKYHVKEGVVRVNVDLERRRQVRRSTCMFDSQGRGNTTLEASDCVEARGGPVGEKVGNDLGSFASADGDEVAVAHSKLDFSIRCLVGIEILKLDATRGEDMLA